MAICACCKEEKTEDEFYIRNNRKSGISLRCKECTPKRKPHTEEQKEKRRVYNKKYRSEHKKEIREYQRKYHSYHDYWPVNHEKRKETARKSSAKYKKDNIEKRAAHNKVANAIKYVKINRNPCSVCGNPKSEAHHSDYSKPLDVVWLCRKHHKELHIKIKESE